MAIQNATDPESLDRAVRVHVFQQAAESASVPSPGEIAQALQVSPDAIDESLRRLAAARVLILAPGSTTIWAANPFCAVPSAFRVSALGRTYWGICIWDALGIAAALHADATLHALCGDCGDEVILEISGGTLTRTEEIVHFGVPAIRWWENIGFT